MQRPPNGMPVFYPTLRYRDALSAIDWLERAFGFERLLVVPGEAGAVSHAEVAFNGGVFMLGSSPNATATEFDAPYAYVANVREHYERAKGAGAEITRDYEEKDYGGAGYSVRDCEGHEWSFGSYVPAPAISPHASEMVPYLCCRDASAAIDFYREAFGADEAGQRYVEADGRVGHADLRVGSAHFFVSDEFAAFGILSPETVGGRSTSVVIEVDDTDVFFARAVAAGATVERDLADQPFGRIGWLVDPYGHRWAISGPAKG